MKSETRQCQNCKKDFVIEPEDFNFYEKIKVPPPTFCPECRMQRRMAWRNERALYKRDCGLCKKSMMSMYPEDTVFPVYCKECAAKVNKRARAKYQPSAEVIARKNERQRLAWGKKQ